MIREKLTRAQFDALIGGELDWVPAIRPNDNPKRPSQVREAVVFPGSFNPIHAAHLEMAKLAAEKCSGIVWFELSLRNADKTTIDLEEASRRLSQDFGNCGVLLTATPLFAAKAKLFPDSVFVVGTDTITRIDDPGYYGGSLLTRAKAIEQTKSNGCKFLVFYRNQNKIATPDPNQNYVDVQEDLKAICDFVPATEFTMNISSTEIRTRPEAGDS